MKSLDGKLCCVLATAFVANAMSMAPVSFLPDFLEARGVHSSLIGLMYMCHGVTMILVSPIAGLCLNKTSHATLMSCACCAQTLMCLTYSISNRINDNNLLLAMYILLKFIGGSAMAVIDVSSYTYLSRRYPNGTEKAISLYETSDATAIITGILIGAICYDILGFSMTFVIFAILIFPLAILNYFVFRDENDGSYKDNDNDNDDIKIISSSETSATTVRDKDSQMTLETGDFKEKKPFANQEKRIDNKEETRQIRYIDLLRKPRILFAAFNFAVIQFSISAFEPTLALRLEEYETGKSIDGLIMALSPIFMTISTFLSPYVLPSCVEWRVVLIISTLLTGVFTTFIGPFYKEKDLSMMCIALSICGLCRGQAFAYTLSEMIDCAGEVKNSNLLSGIMFMSFGIGATIGPGFGGLLYDILGFRWMCNINGLICIVYSIIYFIGADGYDAFHKKRSKRITNIF